MQHLQELVSQDIVQNTDCSSPSIDDRVFSVAIIDAMAEVQSMTTKNVETFDELSCLFADKLLHKYSNFSELHVEFDAYLVNSLKVSERARRQKGVIPNHFKVGGHTKIKNISW